MLEIYTDGSAHPNPGAGGFGVIVLDKDTNKCHNNYQLIEVYNKQFEFTTNNECELKAILYAFLKYGKNIKNKEFVEVPLVYTDSSYALNTFETWMHKWADNGWLKSDNKQIKNIELIQAYYNHYQLGYRIELRKVKGHSGNKWNELADQLATGKITSEQVEKMIEEEIS